MSYFEERVTQRLQLPEDFYTLKVNTDLLGERSLKVDFPILKADADGNICIYPITPDFEVYQFYTKAKNPRPRMWYYTRFEKPIIHKYGKEQKAKFPYNGGTPPPLFGPNLLKAQKEKAKVPTLILTEGYLKAIKGDFHGIPVAGLSSINTFKRKDEPNLPFWEIRQFIERCETTNVIILHDADLFDIKYKNPDKYIDVKEGDMTQRLLAFQANAWNLSILLKNAFPEITVWYSHIKTEFMTESKGLDDLLEVHEDQTEKIVEEITDLKAKKRHYFELMPLNDKKKFLKYFALTNVNNFYAKYEELIGEKKFIYRGGRFQAFPNGINDSKEIKCLKISQVNNFMCVGNKFYEHITKPTQIINKKNEIIFGEESIILPRLPQIIKARFGHLDKKVIESIARSAYYDGFVNRPGHFNNYQQVISTYYNRYNPLSHTPKPFNIPKEIELVRDITEIQTTIKYLEHVFGKQESNGLGDPLMMALDYQKILWENPYRKLPVICLISKENKTGKSKYHEWQKLIYQKNAINIAAKDLTAPFNSFWISSLIVAIDEALIEKNETVERIKSLSTGEEWPYAEKFGNNQVIDIHMKFIICSNNVDNFIRISDEETRFWVNRLTRPEKSDTNLLFKLKEEIPYFLYYLEQRKMTHPDQDRMWFNQKYLENKELAKLKQNSKSWNEKNIFELIEDMVRNEDIKSKTESVYVKLSHITEIIQKELGSHLKSDYITWLLKDKWELKTERMSKFFVKAVYVDKKYSGYVVSDKSKQERFFTFNKDVLKNIKKEKVTS